MSDLPPRWVPDPAEWRRELEAIRRKNYQPENPDNEPTGNHTGRCRKCGSKDLWDDNTAYGCNKCGAFLGN